jgi:inosine-uridine nucleoside N-ribohydrolase
MLLQAYRTVGYDGGMPLHDPSAVMMLLNASLYEMHRYPTTIDTAAYPGATRGLVIADRRGGPLSPPSNASTQFATAVDADGVRSALFAALRSLA